MKRLLKVQYFPRMALERPVLRRAYREYFPSAEVIALLFLKLFDWDPSTQMWSEYARSRHIGPPPHKLTPSLEIHTLCAHYGVRTVNSDNMAVMRRFDAVTSAHENDIQCWRKMSRNPISSKSSASGHGWCREEKEMVMGQNDRP